MMGERDFEVELKEKDEIIMSLRLNEHLLNDKLEISRRNMKKQLERITALEKENEKLLKQVEDCKDYNSKLYANCLQKDRRWLKRIKRVEDELEECIKENAKLREMYINDEVCDLLNEQQGIIEEKNNVITLMGAFIKNNGFSIDDFNGWISKDWHNVGDNDE